MTSSESQPRTYDRELFLRIAAHLQKAAQEAGTTEPLYISGHEYPPIEVPCLLETVAEQIVEKYLSETEAAQDSRPLDVERLARALDVLSDEEYDLMAPEQREDRYESAEELIAAYNRLIAEGAEAQGALGPDDPVDFLDPRQAHDSGRHSWG